MTTMLQARDALVNRINSMVGAAYPTLPLYYGNASIPDYESQAQFLKAEIKFVDGRQADLSATPLFRRFGVVTFYIAVREFSGERITIDLMDFLGSSFQTQNIDGVVMKAARPQAANTQSGWCITEVWIPFEVDHRAAPPAPAPAPPAPAPAGGNSYFPIDYAPADYVQ